MTVRQRRTRGLVRAALALAAAGVLSNACRRISSDGIRIDNVADGGRVINGSAFDTADLDAGLDCLTVPSHARVVRSEDERIHVHLRKDVVFHGMSDEISPEAARRSMGVATQTSGGCVLLGTFGEWQTKEGGARIKMVVAVPPGVGILWRADLAGPESVAAREREYRSRVRALMRARHRSPMDAPPDLRSPPADWPTWTFPADGWTPVASRPASAAGIAALEPD